MRIKGLILLCVLPAAVSGLLIKRRLKKPGFIASVFAYQRGMDSRVSFPNMNPIFHNIYSIFKPRSFDLGAYDKGQTRKITFLKAGGAL